MSSRDYSNDSDSHDVTLRVDTCRCGAMMVRFISSHTKEDSYYVVRHLIIDYRYLSKSVICGSTFQRTLV